MLSKQSIQNQVQSDVVIFKNALTKDQIEFILNSITDPVSMRGTNEYYSNESDTPLYAGISDADANLLLHKTINTLLDEMEKIYGGIAIRSGSSFRYNEYRIGHGYKKHIDRSHNSKATSDREISVVIGANSDYSGGDLIFPRQDLSIRVEAGDVIVFPSGYTHPHEVTPVTKGTRKTIVTWLS